MASPSVVMYLHQNLIPLWVLKGLWSPPLTPFCNKNYSPSLCGTYVHTLISFVCVCPSSLVESRIVSGTSLDGSSFHHHSDAQGSGNGSEIDVVDGKVVICGSVNRPLPHPVFDCLQYTACKNKRGKLPVHRGVTYHRTGFNCIV